MTWLDRVPELEGIKGRGSFKGARFLVEAHQLTSGRRIQDHQFPFIQRNYAEDLGKKTDQFEIDAFFVGPNYDLERNDLLQALKEPGPGLLIHPYLNTNVSVSVLSFELLESKAARNFCQIKMTFIESGGREYPRESVDERSYIDGLATEADTGASGYFEGAYSIARSATSSLQLVRDTINKKLAFIRQIRQAQGAISQALSELELTMTSLGASANQLRLLPGAIGEGIINSISALESSFSTAQGRFSALVRLSENEEMTIGDFNSSSAIQDANNQLALSPPNTVSYTHLTLPTTPYV